MKTHITPELIRSALAHIPANMPRHEWARVAMAIKSEFPDETGCDLFTDWSASADGFDLKAAKSTWQSVKAGGGVGIGTLLHLAKENGFALPKADQAPSKPDPEAVAKREREKADARQREQARIDAGHGRAAVEAVALWGQASDPSEASEPAPYLVRKGVQPYGVRIAPGGWLLVPVRDATGKLWNLQRIAPAKPADNAPDKLFLKGGRKSGLWHLVCNIGSVGELASDGAAPGVLLIAEGYATAASLHQATGYPVAVAFDAGNLASVAKALRNQYPAALLVLCGDDDVHTLARTGHNPGRDKATATARTVHGLAVFPDSLPEGGSDFNDMHQAAGLDAVRVCVQGAIDAHQVQHQAHHKAATQTKGSNTRRKSKGASQDAPQEDGEAAADDGRAYEPFAVDDSGVWHRGADQDGNRKPPEWVCSRLDVQARTRDQDGGGWGYLLSFADPLGHPKQWAMPARMLSGDGGEYRATLLNTGLRIASTHRARNLLTQYIQTRHPEEFASCTDRIGWHGRAFVLPKDTIGDQAERIVFQTDNAVENTFRVKGTPAQWRERVGVLCAGNSRLVFAV